MKRSQLLYVSWSLTAEDGGVVIVQYASEAGEVATERYGLTNSASWNDLPPTVREVLREDGRRRGAWYG